MDVKQLKASYHTPTDNVEEIIKIVLKSRKHPERDLESNWTIKNDKPHYGIKHCPDFRGTFGYFGKLALGYDVVEELLLAVSRVSVEDQFLNALHVHGQISSGHGGGPAAGQGTFAQQQGPGVLFSGAYGRPEAGPPPPTTSTSVSIIVSTFRYF